MKFINTSVYSEDEDSCDDASNMVMSPSSAKPILVLSSDFGLTGSEIGELISPHFA